MVNFLCFPWSSSSFSLSLSLLLLSVASFPFVTSRNFNFNFTGSDRVQIHKRLTFQGDTQYTPDGIQLTGNIIDKNVTGSVERVLYGDRLYLGYAAVPEAFPTTISPPRALEFNSSGMQFTRIRNAALSPDLPTRESAARSPASVRVYNSTEPPTTISPAPARDFNSTEPPTTISPAPARDFNSTEPPTTISPTPARDFNSIEPPNTNIHENRTRLLLVIGLGIILCVLGLLWFVLWQRWRKKQGRHGKAIAAAARLQTVFDQRRGPRSFAYQDLANATNNFAEAGKLGAGGFGAVYRGVIPSMENDLPVAIKKISRESMQGEKEYMSEVILFSQLRHRNLVQLIGYCHEADDFLLVYEYMPNRSLDKHLYGGHRLLGWAERHKIALGLASALLYLHEEWEQCVVHRDIKPSNVMLDPDFNAKLGDFGLARLVDHDCTAATTVLAGTRGYIAPEYERTGKARKESDVFSFGVVMLEMACGRKPINYAEELERINLVQWAWGLYEKELCLEAADRRLPYNELDEQIMERLMVVGLWCAHPDYRLRPSIRRAIGVLSFEAPLQDLPPLNMARQEGNDAAALSSGGQSLNNISSSSYAYGR